VIGYNAYVRLLNFAGSTISASTADNREPYLLTRPEQSADPSGMSRMNLFDPDLAYPILGAVVAGAIIGAEREYRASPAGFRTHILVSLSCALLMLAAVHQVRWLSDTPSENIRIDPVRMAHGILTGIGFLCGGVIFREGFGVRGLTTAASLWMTASLGILFGVGFYALAIAGAMATVCVLAAARASETILPQRRYANVKVRFLRSASVSQLDFRDRLSGAGLLIFSVQQSMDSESTEFSATVSGDSEERMGRLTSDLQSNQDVMGFDYIPHDV
jgi:putative Mg2+ transporter-C (MgtC) family protein